MPCRPLPTQDRVSYFCGSLVSADFTVCVCMCRQYDIMSSKKRKRDTKDLQLSKKARIENEGGGVWEDADHISRGVVASDLLGRRWQTQLLMQLLSRVIGGGYMERSVTIYLVYYYSPFCLLACMCLVRGVVARL